jgi:hypothetical protein
LLDIDLCAPKKYPTGVFVSALCLVGSIWTPQFHKEKIHFFGFGGMMKPAKRYVAD